MADLPLPPILSGDFAVLASAAHRQRSTLADIMIILPWALQEP
jgi:hypothetical protein